MVWQLFRVTRWLGKNYKHNWGRIAVAPKAFNYLHKSGEVATIR